MADLHVISTETLQDVPAKLRRWADDIEAGKYGQPQGCVLVLDADTIEIGYMGTGEAAPNAVLLLQAGLGKLIRAVLEAKA